MEKRKKFNQGFNFLHLFLIKGKGNIMKWIYFCLVALFQTSWVCVAGNGYLPGGRSLALGGASVALPGVWSTFTNQAGLAWQQGWQAGLYAENRFMMKELSFEAVAVSWSGKPGAFGLAISHFGFQLYSEIEAGLVYARSFGKHFSAGVQLNYIMVQISEGYGSGSLVSCEAGIMYKPDINWTIGIQVCNPFPVKVSNQPEELLPVSFRLGAGYNLSGKVLILVEGEKDLENPLVFRTGLEVRIAGSFYGRVGFLTGPISGTAGLGMTLGRLVVDIGTRYNMTLGFSPAISIGYIFKTELPQRTQRNREGHGRDRREKPEEQTGGSHE